MPAARYNRLLRIFWRVHGWLFLKSSGRIGGKIGSVPVLMLMTTGRKSSKQRNNTLYYFRDQGNYVVVASNAGRDQPPAWLLNLKARPEATVLVHGRRVPVLASIAGGDDQARLWAQAVKVDPNYQEYQSRTARPIPVVILKPIENDGTEKYN
jgi:deazaflavin-dependent oxidoreductase (nitroreductase family)